MKRVLAYLMVLFMCLPGRALAERTVYADQGGVRVFSENGKAGLMDSDGNVLCPAKYDEIAPFRGGDYAMTLLDGRAGVLGRDGSERIACAWDNDFSRLLTGTRYARMCDDLNDQRLIDLETGETVMQGEYIFGEMDGCIYALSYGFYDYWELQGPFTTQVFDLDMNPVITLDGDLEARVPAGWITADGAHWSDRFYTLRNVAGAPVVENLTLYDIGPDGVVYYTRHVDNLIGNALGKLGYKQANVKWILHNLFGFDLDGAKEIARRTMGDWNISGIWRPDGSLMEVKADALRCPLEPDGLCPAQVGERWGYMDRAGSWVIEPRYQEAGPFIDGTAVVIENDMYHLIDRQGAALPLRWEGQGVNAVRWGKGPACCRQRVIAGVVDGGVRLFDRRGEFVTDEVFDAEHFIPVGSAKSGPLSIYDDGIYLLRDADGRVCAIDGDGWELCRFEAETWEVYDAVDDGAALEARRDGLWGLVNLTGPEAGQWRVEPVYRSIYGEADGVYCLNRMDYTSVYADSRGNALGPQYVYETQVNLWKMYDANNRTVEGETVVYMREDQAETEQQDDGNS